MWGTRTIEKFLNPIDMLTADHERVDKLFDDFERSGPFMKKAIALQLCQEVKVHATLEEEIFYPAAEMHLGVEGEDIVARSYQDHHAIKDLIRRIERSMASVSTQPFADQMRILQHRIQEHVRLEQNRLFPMAEVRLQLHELAAAMDRRRVQLMARHPTPRAVTLLAGGAIVLGLGILFLSGQGED